MVITGLGLVSPLGTGISEYWKNFLKDKRPLEKIYLFSTKEFKCKYAFQIYDSNFNRYFKYLKSEYIPRSTKFLLTAAALALKDAGLKAMGSYNNEDIGVFTSTIYGSSEASYHFILQTIFGGPDSVDPMAFPPALINYSSNYLSIVNNFKGPNITFSSGFHAGLEAINFASNLIRQGIIKAALVSGLNDLCAYSYAQLSLKKVLFEPKNKKGYLTGLFDPARNGLILGENASTIILENWVCAKKRGAKIYAEISGYSSNFGRDEPFYGRAINEAVGNSGLRAEDIELCMLNSNGIKSIDKMELNAIKNVFKDNLDKIDFMAIKENNGESEGASGILQALIAAKVMYSRKISPSIYRYIKSGLFGRIKTGYNPRRNQITNTVINAFNLEGNNAVLIIKGFN